MNEKIVQFIIALAFLLIGLAADVVSMVAAVILFLNIRRGIKLLESIKNMIEFISNHLIILKNFIVIFITSFLL